MELKGYNPLPPPSESKNIKGWLLFFLFQLACGGAISFITIISGLNLEDYVVYSEPYAYLGVSVDAFSALGLLGMAAYTIFAFKKRKPNAVYLGRIAVVVVMLMNITILLLGDLEADGMGSARQIIQTLVWNVVWLIYLSKSEQVERLFPRAERIFYKRDLWLFLIVLLPLAWLAGIFLLY